jgi:adenylosuccinate synthase
VADCAEAFSAFAARVRLVDSSYLAGLLRAGPVVFEGAQGVLLDEWHGFHPYTTWSTTTFAQAETLLDGVPAQRLGVVRTYMTRHGPGPFVTEDPALALPESHNGHGDWQGAFRVGHFDAVALRYALEVTGPVDGLAVTHLDACSGASLKICESYEGISRLSAGPPDLLRQEQLTARLLTAKPVLSEAPADWVTGIEKALGYPVVLTSSGPRSQDKTSYF